MLFHILLYLFLVSSCHALITRPIPSKQPCLSKKMQRLSLSQRLSRWNPSMMVVSMTSSNSISEIQSTLVKTLTTELGLKTTDYTDVYQSKSWSTSDYTGTSEWMDEIKGSKLTGIASSSYGNTKSGLLSVSVSGWAGPTSSVPHFLLTINELSKDIYHLVADYIPRGPQTMGTDNSYFTTYYNNPQLLKKYNDIHHSAEKMFLSNDFNFFERTLRSPNYVSVVQSSYEKVSSYSIDMVNQWIEWIRIATPVETRSRGAMNSRDDKLRQFFFASNLHKTQSLLPNEKDFARLLAAGWTGPISEAYVGGGS